MRAVARVIELSRKHLYDLPENVACPPGCAECCSGYEPFVSSADVQRIADHFGLTYEEVIDEYVVQRESADGYIVGWLRKSTRRRVSTTSPTNACSSKARDRATTTAASTKARPHDCRAFTPIGCDDVDWSLRPRCTNRRITSSSAIRSEPRNGAPTNGRHNEPLDVAIVGGGHNGLIAAAYCARAGLRTIVLERRACWAARA